MVGRNGRAGPPEGAPRRRARRAQRRAAAARRRRGSARPRCCARRSSRRRLPRAARARDGDRVRHPVRRARRARHAAARPPRRAPGGAGARAARRARARPGHRRTTASRCPPRCSSLLARAADERPVLVAIDDAQWLDEPSLEAFLFAGRRLGQEGVAMLGALRDGTAAAASRCRGWTGWRSSRCPTTRRASCSTRDRVAGGRRPARRHRRRQPARAAGDPGLLSDAQLAGREPLEDPLRPGTGVERAFRRAARRAAGDRRAARCWSPPPPHTGRLDAIGAALQETGLSLDDLEPAEEARIVTIADGELEFRHPLLRSTVYHAASPPSGAPRTPRSPPPAEGSPERAWHLAACAVAPDEEVAAALEEAALDARGRGAHATAARDFGRAAQLTPDDEPRARRLLEAATDATRSRRGRPRARAARRGGATDRRPAAGRRRAADDGPRRDAPRLAAGRLRAARRRGRARPLARSRGARPACSSRRRSRT